MITTNHRKSNISLESGPPTTYRLLAVGFFLCWPLLGCSEPETPQPEPPQTVSPSEPSTSPDPEPETSYKMRTEGTAAIPPFKDVLSETGISFRHHFLNTETGENYRINPYDHGSGICVADVNGDGWDDIYFLDFQGPNRLYLNKQGLQFQDFTEQSGLALDRAISVGAAFGDFDNDGDPDLYVTTYRGGNHLYRNHGDGTFEDITQAAGVHHNGHSSATTWFDYDLDGNLDLYLTNIGKFTTETISEEADYFFEGTSLPIARLAQFPDGRNPGESDILWRNNGDGTFTDTTATSGLGAAEWNGDVTIADVDLDGYVDVYVSNMFGQNHLYHNTGNGTFEEITHNALDRTSWGAMGCKFFDANGDAYPDLYVVDMHSDMWIESAQDYSIVKPTAKYDTPMGNRSNIKGKIIVRSEDSQASRVLFGNTFFVNNGDGTFTEQTDNAGLENWWPWGITVGDYNNDGSQDLFIASGMGYPYFYWQNHLYLNEGSGTFFDASTSSGIEPPQSGTMIADSQIKGVDFTRSSRSAATADFDRDGDLEIVVNNFNHEPYFLRNDSPEGNYLRIRLLGTRSNRDCYGARITVHAAGQSWNRQLCSAEGYLTQNSIYTHIGLGETTQIDKIEIFWPGSTDPTTLLDIGSETKEIVVEQP